MISNTQNTGLKSVACTVANWCKENDFELNTSKTKEFVVDFLAAFRRNTFSAYQSSGGERGPLQYLYTVHYTSLGPAMVPHTQPGEETYLRQQRVFKLPLRVYRNVSTERNSEWAYQHMDGTTLLGGSSTQPRQPTRPPSPVFRMSLLYDREEEPTVTPKVIIFFWAVLREMLLSARGPT